MGEREKQTVEDDIKNSGLSADLQKAHLAFCHFIKNNGFSIEMEEDGNGWQIRDMNACVGHTNYRNVGIWIDTCDFGSGGSTDDIDAALKKTVWAHVRICEYYTSGGKQCGCGKQPGTNETIFGKEHGNLCFSRMEFINPDVETIENIQKLMLLLKQNKMRQ